MNNYSFLQRKLHQFALSSKFMREVIFDAENFFTTTQHLTDNHVFISGLARSGTTILLNALHESDEFASLSYRDMPFVLAPNLWSKLYSNKQKINYIERAHGDGIKVSSSSPEAFEEVFWMTFDQCDELTQQKFEKYVELINHRYGKKRYISKNNHNLKRLKLISKIFPNSQKLILFRNPIQHSFSLLSQHRRFITYSKEDIFISNYMKWTGHSEFGPNYRPIQNKNLKFIDDLDLNHWLEQWYITYRNCLETYKNYKNINFICYEKLCSSKVYWLELMQRLKVKETYEFEFRETTKNIEIKIDDYIHEKVLLLYSELLEHDFRRS